MPEYQRSLTGAKAIAALQSAAAHDVGEGLSSSPISAASVSCPQYSPIPGIGSIDRWTYAWWQLAAVGKRN